MGWCRSEEVSVLNSRQIQSFSARSLPTANTLSTQSSRNTPCRYIHIDVSIGWMHLSVYAVRRGVYSPPLHDVATRSTHALPRCVPWNTQRVLDVFCIRSFVMIVMSLSVTSPCRSKEKKSVGIMAFPNICPEQPAQESPPSGRRSMSADTRPFGIKKSFSR
jgi:hypothetical protein